MARNLIFKIKGAEFSAVPVKVDRSKLYGWTALKGLDDSGKECKIVNMDESGTLIIPKGGLGLGIITCSCGFSQPEPPDRRRSVNNPVMCRFFGFLSFSSFHLNQQI